MHAVIGNGSKVQLIQAWKYIEVLKRRQVKVEDVLVVPNHISSVWDLHTRISPMKGNNAGKDNKHDGKRTQWMSIKMRKGKYVTNKVLYKAQ
jgi:mannose/fructose/N-acetylgalactosamine-specific phosphotransferase system component IIB